MMKVSLFKRRAVWFMILNLTYVKPTFGLLMLLILFRLLPQNCNRRLLGWLALAPGIPYLAPPLVKTRWRPKVENKRWTTQTSTMQDPTHLPVFQEVSRCLIQEKRAKDNPPSNICNLNKEEVLRWLTSVRTLVASFHAGKVPSIRMATLCTDFVNACSTDVRQFWLRGRLVHFLSMAINRYGSKIRPSL